MKEGTTKAHNNAPHLPNMARLLLKKSRAIEAWTQGPIEKRKVLAYLDRIPLHIPLNEALSTLPSSLKIPQEMAAEARDYLLLISSMVPKKNSETGLENEIHELLNEIPKINNPTEKKRAEKLPWVWGLFLSPTMAASMGVALSMYFVLKWAMK
jgi:hypothetical protein